MNDYKALIVWLRDFEGSGSNGTNEAADAVEALVAENQKLLSEDPALAHAELSELTREYIALKTERDALQAQLDNMVTEARTDWKFIPMSTSGEGRHEKVREQRLVGQWAEVPA